MAMKLEGIITPWWLVGYASWTCLQLVRWLENKQRI